VSSNAALREPPAVAEPAPAGGLAPAASPRGLAGAGTLAMLVAVAAVIAAPFVLSPFAITLLNYIGISALVALGLVLLTGMGGLTSFGQAAFVGIGAYATAWLTVAQGLSPWLGLGLALLASGAVAALLGAVTLRLGGHFLPLSTIAWGIAIFFLFGNIAAFGGHNGLAGVPPVTLGPLSFATNSAMYGLIWLFLGAALWLVSNLLQSREGRAIRSLRGGAVMVESLGISVFRTRLMAFVIAALLAGLSGWLYAHMTRFVSPAPFDVRPSIDYLLMAIAGGAGHVVGAVVGATIVTLLKNWLQDVLPLVTGSNAAQLEIVVFSILFVLLLQHARGGLVPFVTRRLPRPLPPLPTEAPPLPRRDLPAPGTPLLSVEGMTKRFGGLVAVNEVGFELKAGEILGLIGPNGAGKSTMFNLITGALKATAGRVRFAGEDITGWPQRRIAAAGIARTFQHVKLRPNMTLLDNVVLGAYARTRAGYLQGALRLDRTEERQARFEALQQLRRVGLGDRPYELAGNLALGSQRTLEVARALAADPALIVLDEPAAGLRRLEKQALADLLRSLRAEGVTILLVEHDMDFVMNLCDRLVVMDFGSKLTEGLPAAVRADRRVQEAYLGGVA
jgi:ABC-type branched-subunit amino acid transport system ATPase component/ABC-type branched-subunit amino acid transport system permease subunit